MHFQVDILYLNKKTGVSNSQPSWTVVYFDIIDNRIGFWTCAGSPAVGSNQILGSHCNYKNAYFPGTTVNRSAFNSSSQRGYTPAISGLSTSWFAGTALSAIPGRQYPTVGYADLANKNNGRYTVAAHIEDVGDGWKRVSACTYYFNNHMDNVIYIGFWPGGQDVASNAAGYIHTIANVSLWGFQEELITNPSTIETLSAWYPAPYIPQASGVITLNLTTGEQL